jgi:hypothetical protein
LPETMVAARSLINIISSSPNISLAPSVYQYGNRPYHQSSMAPYAKSICPSIHHLLSLIKMLVFMLTCNFLSDR